MRFKTHSNTHAESFRDGSLKYKHNTLGSTANFLIPEKTEKLYK
jgi:hypothetical protein